MNFGIPLFPEAATEYAEQVDHLYAYLNVVSIFFTVAIMLVIFIFGIIYHRKSEADRPVGVHGNLLLEIIWSVIPFGFIIVMFIWGTDLFFQESKPPKDAVEYLVTGKQWMWKIQHPNGKREINDFHIPVDTAIRLTMTSEDVLHSFYVPAFRVKKDTLPGRYTQLWFKPNKVGEYHLFCAEYCGTEHSRMIGTVYVMEPEDYQAWAGESGMISVAVSGGTPVEAGKEIFTSMGCAVCHSGASGALGPSLNGVFGHEVELADGTKVMADENYLRESILNSASQVVKGYQPVMPMYKGMLSEDQIQQVIAYIKSLEK